MQSRELASIHQDRERIRNITLENKKLIERLVETRVLVDNKTPAKPASYLVKTSPKKKAKRVESMNLVARLRESERI